MKSKNKMRKMFANAFLLMMLCANGIVGFASSGEVSIYISPNQVWTSQSDNTDSRSGAYSTVYARNHAVRPTSGTDNFAKIQTRVTNGYGTVISDTYTLSESATSSTSITIKEGYLASKLVGFQFRGNTNKEAYAIVSYDGR